MRRLGRWRGAAQRDELVPPPGPARSRGAQRRGQLRCHLRERRWGRAQGPAEPRAGAGRTGTRTGLWTWPPSPPSLPPPPSGAGRAWPGGSGGRGLCGPFPLGVRERLSLPGREAERRRRAAGPAMEEGSSSGSSRSYAQRPAVGGCEVSPRSGSGEREARRASGAEPSAERAPVVVEA